MPDAPAIVVGHRSTAGRGARRLAYRCLLVAVGGFLGTLARYGIGSAVDDVEGFPVATLSVNALGAFAFGVLLERLATRGADPSRRRDLRLFAGTGFLGSFTTYSSFAVETERLLATGASSTALGYLATSLVCGLAACVAGVTVADRYPTRGRGTGVR
ncbi:MAG: fluoride efflux transporter FluC [Nocardioidaceae bacterium]